MLEKLTDHKTMFYVFMIDQLLRVCVLNGIFPHFQEVWLARVCYLYIPWVVFLIGYEIIKKKLVLNKYTIAVFLFWGIAVVSTALNGALLTPTSIHHLSNFLMISYIFFSIPFIYGAAETKKILIRISYWIIAAVVFLSVSSLLFWVFVRLGGTSVFGHEIDLTDFFVSRSHGKGTRYAGFFTWPTIGASRCTLACTLSLYLLHERKINKYLAAVNLITSTLLMILFDARSGLLCFGFLGLAAIWRFLDSRKGRKFANNCLFAGTAIGIVGILIWQAPAFMTLYNKSGLFKAIKRYTSGRMTYLTSALEGFKIKPLLGWGFVQRVTVELEQKSAMNTHNLFSNLLQWTGLCGSAVFLYLMGASMKAIWHDRKKLLFCTDFWYLVIIVNMTLQAMFNVGIIGAQTEMCAVFWCGLGYLLKRCMEFREAARGERNTGLV